VSINLVWRSDVHVSDNPPASRVDDWNETLMGKLSQVGEIAREVGAAAVLDGGDFFHIKSPARNAHRTIQRVAAVHAGYPCPVYGNVGNHDCKYGDYAHLPEQPLGVLFETGVFRRCFDEHEAVFEADGVKVRVVGIPYHGTEYDWDRFTRIKKGDESYLVVMAHVLASKQGGTMFEGEDIIQYAALAELDPDVWCFLPGTQVIDWGGRVVPIEKVQESLALAGRRGMVSVEQVHPARYINEEVVTFDIEGVPCELIPGVTVEHPFWVAKRLRCRLPSRSTRRCHQDKPKDSYPCSACTEPPIVVPDWCPARDIEPGDYMAVPVPALPVGGNQAPGLARLLGLYLAEGHIIENRDNEPVAGVGWSFHEDEVHLHEDVGGLVGEHFGLSTHPHKTKGRCIQVCAYSPAVADFCLTHGGRHAEAKELSSWAWGLSGASRMELLVGWLDGDGHARNPERYDRVRAEVMGATVSPRLASQLYLLALSVGLRPYYTIRPAGETKWADGRISQTLPCHCISFYGEDARMLAARMQVTIPDLSKTTVAGFFADGLYWVRVRGVARKAYQGPVYNMRTSTQEYVAGLLLTHNCLGHWHKNQGITEIATGKWVINVGSLSRGALSQDDLNRTPTTAILKFDPFGVDISERPLVVAPPEEVFDLDGRARREVREMTMSAFVDSLESALSEEAKKPVEDAIREMAGMPDEVKERAIDYWEQQG